MIHPIAACPAAASPQLPEQLRAGLTLPAGTPPPQEVDLGPLIQEIEALGAALALQAPCRVILFNDDSHAFTDVIRIVMIATGCASQRALRITQQAHVQGSAVAYEGDREECQRVADVFERAALRWRLD